MILTFIVYESQLLKLLRYSVRCGSKLTKFREIQNTGSQLILQINCEKGKLTLREVKSPLIMLTDSFLERLTSSSLHASNIHVSN